MIPKNVVRSVNTVREHVNHAIELLGESATFPSLLATSPRLAQAFNDMQSILSKPRLRRPCDGRVTCAFVGSSGHGKTTIMDEMFPSLSKRGWLVTDVTDTTAQSLRIEHAPSRSPESSKISVRSWSLDELKELMSHPEVVEQNERDQIHVVYHEDRIDVDGSEAGFPATDLEQFRFPRRITLRPFDQPYMVDPEQARDPGFIRSLTIKEQSAALDPGPVLELEGTPYDSLQLRALVRDVTLRDGYAQIKRWAGNSAVKDLVFIDTPGLAVSGSIKDEVLRHFLERKSNQIVMRLWKEDELDIVVHLVLCGRQTDFAEMWKTIERECGPGAMEDLAERLILAINGTNIYFTNRDLRKRFADPSVARREGDQFATTIEDNILQKMSPHGRVMPARICFLDSRSIVETVSGQSYARAYAAYCREMARWVSKGGVGRKTLEALGLLETFEENAQALADPEDRGQGFLIRQLLDLIAAKGPTLLLRKYLVKTRLLSASERFRTALLRCYEPDGRLSAEGLQEAVRSCLGFLDAHDLKGIESFAAEEIDPALEELVPSPVGVARNGIPNPQASPGHGESGAQDHWVVTAFRRMGGHLRERILARGRPAAAVRKEFSRYFDDLLDSWSDSWGYTTARLTAPERGGTFTAELVRHCLATHGREIIYQLVTDQDEGTPGPLRAPRQQDREDRARVSEALSALEQANRLGREICAEFGVEA